jgi:cation/acetate symporter
VIAARVSSVIVGIMAIYVGIAAEGQNVAHLVALAFAVAASSNLPAVFLTLYWKRANTYGIVAGMVVGAVTAIALVMISPNMTYPKAVLKEADKVLNGEPAQPAKEAVPAQAASSFMCELFAMEGCVASAPAKAAATEKPAKPGAAEKLATLNAKLATLSDEKDIAAVKKDIAATEKAKAKAEGDLKKFEGQTTSMMGLEKPYFLLKNPGLISIPLGFLVVILGSAAVPRQAFRGNVGRTLRAPEHRHPRGRRHRPLSLHRPPPVRRRKRRALRPPVRPGVCFYRARPITRMLKSSLSRHS